MARRLTAQRLVAILACLALVLSGGGGTAAGAPSRQTAEPGITPTEIILGTHQPLSGPASSYNVIIRSIRAYFDYVNETEGGVHGRKITIKVEDDGYAPNNTVTVVKKLVEEDRVFAIFNGLGTPTHSAVMDYLNDNKIPDMYVNSGASKWGEPVKRYVFAWIPDYITEGQVLAKYVAQAHEGKKVGMIYQNDDFGKDYVKGVKQVLGSSNPIVAEESHEVTASDLNSQVANLKSKGSDVVMLFVIPKFAGIAIRSMREQGMTQPIVMTSVSNDPTLIDLAGGKENVEGIVTTGWAPIYDDDSDPRIVKHKELMAKYAPGLQVTNFTVAGQGSAELMVETLRRLGPNPTREGLIEAAESIQCYNHMPFGPTSMSPTDHKPIESLRLQKFEGGKTIYFGDLIKAGNDEKVNCP